MKSVELFSVEKLSHLEITTGLDFITVTLPLCFRLIPRKPLPDVNQEKRTGRGEEMDTYNPQCQESRT